MNIHCTFLGIFFRIIAIICAEIFISRAVAAGPTFSDGAPFAATQPAWWLDGSTAALNGMVTPGSSSTAVWFEWGTDGSYQYRTDPILLDASDRTVAVPATISGLTNGIIYQNRVV